MSPVAVRAAPDVFVTYQQRITSEWTADGVRTLQLRFAQCQFQIGETHNMLRVNVPFHFVMTTRLGITLR